MSIYPSSTGKWQAGTTKKYWYTDYTADRV